jgi:integrase
MVLFVVRVVVFERIARRPVDAARLNQDVGRRLDPAPLQISGIARTEPLISDSNRFIRDDDSAFGQKIFDIGSSSRKPANDNNDWLFPSESGNPIGRDNLWRRHMLPRLKPAGLEWATFQVMRRTFASRSKQAGVDAHTRSAQMGNTVDVNENEYAVASFEQKLAAVRRLETAVIQ